MYEAIRKASLSVLSLGIAISAAAILGYLSNEIRKD